MLRLTYYIYILLFYFGFSNLWAQTTILNFEKPIAISADNDQVFPDGGFIHPNELYPQSGMPVFSTVDKDSTLLALGTVRGFIGAFLSRSNGLILLDSDLAVTVYNRIETALLEVSKDISDYRFLRFQASFDQWSGRSGPIILSDPKAWAWWQRRVRKNESFEVFHRPRQFNEVFFKNVNYIYDEPAYSFLSELAKRRAIWSITGDFTNSELIDEIVNLARSKNILIGAVDISNAHQPGWIPPKYLVASLKRLHTVSSPNARLIIFNFHSYAAYSFKPLISSSREIPWALERLGLGYWPEANSVDDRSAYTCDGLFW